MTTNEPAKKVQMTEGIFTEELIAEMRAKTGIILRIDQGINNEEATRMAILKFADGIGDPNPLWRNEEYAKKTRYGSIIAPPSWVFSVFAGINFGWKGLGGFHSSTDAEFYKPIYRNDKIKPQCQFNGFDGPKPSSFAEKVIVNKKENTYRNQNGELVAKVNWFVTRMERLKARQKGRDSAMKLPHQWSEADLKQIEADILAEEPRGANIRYWEDVEVGEKLKHITKGPLGMTDEIAYLIGGGAPIARLAAHGVMLRSYQTHPAWAYRDPDTGALEPIFSVHYNKAAAFAQGGLPLQYDIGFQRHTWQMHLLTNWMGDDGWLKRTHVEFRKFVYFSDVVHLEGTVTKKYIDDNGEPCVDIDTTAINQRNEAVMPGNGTVILPSREKKTFPLDTRQPVKK
jgi:acyl dehydratase